jgi:hypothetical protein
VGEDTVLGLDCIVRKEELLTRGPGLSAAGGVPVREGWELGCGLRWWLGRIGARRPAFMFFCSDSFSFSVFLFYSISFAWLIQTNSNQFLTSSKNQNKVLNQ